MHRGTEPPVSREHAPETNLFHALGGREGCHRLASAFYAHVEHDPILRPLYPPTLKGCPIKALAAFLVQFLGGPSDYARGRWWLSLREAHLRFKIGQQEREAWLNDMFQALDEVKIEEPTRSALRWYFVQASALFVNQPHPPADHPPILEDDPKETPNEPMASRIHQDIAQRWHAQRALEDLVAVVRKGDADRALTLIESPLAQISFKRDRAAFLSLLAIMSSSGQQALLDYVHQTLINHPELLQERYTYDRTLLHGMASQGRLSLVTLLLRLGADPNASDGGGHTPLYCVGNECHGAGGAQVVHALVQAGANVDVQDKVQRCTALHMAARRGNRLVAEALLDCGADVEARDRLGNTPLHRAVNCGKAEMVAFLLSRGADAHAKGKSGLSPWQTARGERIQQVLQAGS